MQNPSLFLGNENNIRWGVDLYNETLTIFGSGRIQDYQPYRSSLPPWAPLRDKFTRIVMFAGITRVGDYAFFPYDYDEFSTLDHHLSSVRFPGTLQSIGHSAFRGNPYLEKINLVDRDHLLMIESFAFAACQRLQTVDLSGCKMLASLQKHAFSDCPNLHYINLLGCNKISAESIAMLRSDIHRRTTVITPEGRFLTAPNVIA